MIRTLGTDEHELDADVLIVGAGTVGLTVAARLAGRGLNVVCLESGERSQDADHHPLNEVIHRRLRYDGAANGRFRCLGGTSTRWGGALIPFLPDDLASADWPIPYEELARYVPEVEQLFQLQAGPYSFPELVALPEGSFVPRMAKWPPFARRNVANMLGATVEREGGPAIWLNATATDFEIEGERLVGVTARSAQGGRIHVRAREVIVAAGAIETTRLLLVMDRQAQGRIFAPDDQLGRYFSDHLSIPVADLEPIDPKALNRLAGFRFEPGGTMRNLRFELAESSPLRAHVPPAFAHISYPQDQTGGFAALREVMQYLQKRSIPPFRVWLRLAGQAPWLMRAVWWRFVEKRLLFPQGGALELHMVTEQAPDARCRITLSDERFDAFGMPLAQIDWAIGEGDFAALTRASDAFEDSWQRSGLAGLARLVRRPRDEVMQNLADSGGIFHPVGSTRMAASSGEGAVDADLRPFRLTNTTVLATSVLPASGGANPTMMLFLLGLRAVDRIVDALAGEPGSVATGMKRAERRPS